jgi:hypothetical protein
VKQKFLGIKAKVDAMVRQNASLSKERFGAALLGNPGTGNFDPKPSLPTTDKYFQERLQLHGITRNSYARLAHFLETNSWRLLDLALQMMGLMFARST